MIFIPLRPTAATAALTGVLGEWSQRRSLISLDVSSLVSQIEDLSTRSDDATQATSGNRPVVDTVKAPGRSAILSVSGDYLEAQQDSQIVALVFNVYVPATLSAERGVAARGKGSGTKPAFELGIG